MFLMNRPMLGLQLKKQIVRKDPVISFAYKNIYFAKLLPFPRFFQTETY